MCQSSSYDYEIEEMLAKDRADSWRRAEIQSRIFEQVFHALSTPLPPKNPCDICGRERDRLGRCLVCEINGEYLKVNDLGECDEMPV